MFGALFFERDPLRFRDLPGLFHSWVQDAGGFAMLAILLWLLFGYLRMRPVDKRRSPGLMPPTFLWSFIGAVLAYGAALVVWGVEFIRTGAVPTTDSAAVQKYAYWLLFAGGAFALIAAGLPFVRGLFALRF